MFSKAVTACFRALSGPPAFRAWGKARAEQAWRVVEVRATQRRNWDSRWPRLWRGTCITWTDEVVAVGWDFAAQVVREQAASPASRERPVEVPGRRLRGGLIPDCSTVLAHECGHTWQVRRLGLLYWPVVGALTLFREGDHWYNHFENQASAVGQFGGIVDGSVLPRLLDEALGGG